MILRIKEFFESRLLISEITSQQDIEHKLKLSCAVLLYEIVHIDGVIHNDEEKKIHQILKNQFNISDTETEELLNVAHEKRNSSVDHYQFTSLINEHYSQQQKIFLVEQLWKIAYADNHLDKFEEHQVRKISELLHVPHKYFIQTKHKMDKGT